MSASFLERFRTFCTEEQGRLIILGVLFGGIALLGAHQDTRNPVASSETRFVEYSKSGMQIVPASCPSSPHYSGECSSYSQSSYVACTPSYSCSGSGPGSHLVNSCTGAAGALCAYGCAGGVCSSAPNFSGNIVASPALIRQGATTEIAWTTTGMSSCTVVDNNSSFTDSWTGTTGDEISSAISEQTTYTLTCSKVGGGVFSDTVTVNIIPVFEEQ